MPVTDKVMIDDDLAEEALHWVVRLHSGEADEHQFRAFADWRALSPLKEKAAKEAEVLWNEMSQLDFDASSGLVRLKSRSLHFSRRDVLKSVAIIVTAGSLSGIMWGCGIFRRLSADYVSMISELKTIELNDGSSVFLNARSAVDIQFSPSLRQVILREGQAYFKIVRDVSRPFEVKVHDVSIVALGSSFDVSRNLADAVAEVALVSHSALVKSGYGSPIKLSAGEMIRVDRAGKPGEVLTHDVDVTMAWHDGVYIAEERTLGDIVSALAAWYPGIIYLRDQSVAELKVNAVLDLRDPAGSIKTLEAGLPIKVRHYSKYLTTISIA